MAGMVWFGFGFDGQLYSSLITILEGDGGTMDAARIDSIKSFELRTILSLYFYY